MPTKPSTKLWGGRFNSEITTETEDFTQSIEVDSRMVAHDIWGSQAHAIMLARVGIISDEDLRQILRWLGKAEEDFRDGKFFLKPEKEDVHMNVESYLIEGAGREYGGKLHTARSRNDQVLVDTHLVTREQILRTQEGTSRLCRVFLAIAWCHVETVMPGYTHTQHAQPISLGFWATAYVSMFIRDLKRLDAAYALANMNPLGACALAGTSFPIDRHLTTKLLGFDAVHEHALDVISSRDFIAQTLFALSMLMSNLSRLGEEIVYWTTYEFGMAVLDDAYSSGSSIMPQKKNPDVPELVRGKSARVYANLFALLTLMKSQPLAYNKDNQEDKEPLFDSVDTTHNCVKAFADMLPHIKVNRDRLLEAAKHGYATATDLADYLVKKKVPFRDAHEVVGKTVKYAIAENKQLDQLSLHELQKFSPSIGEDVFGVLSLRGSVSSKNTYGGTSPKQVSIQLKLAQQRMQDFKVKQAP